MKKIFLAVAALSLGFYSCNDKFDEHFSGDTDMKEVVGVTIVDKTVKEFLATQPEFSSFNEDFVAAPGIDKQLSRVGAKVTVWAVPNDLFDAFPFPAFPVKDSVMKYHINNFDYSYADLRDRMQIVSLSDGVYIDVVSDASKTGDNGVYLNYDPRLPENRIKIERSYKLLDGYVHQISGVMVPKVSMYEFIEKLGDNYSIIRDSIMFQSYKKFDLANSTPQGFDETGNVIYDSAFVLYNPIFAKIDFSDKSKKLSVMLPDNAAVEAALDASMNLYLNSGVVPTLADTLLVYQWIKEAIFFNDTNVFAPWKTQGAVALGGNRNDIATKYNPYSRIWRKTIQVTDTSHPELFNNGEGYYVSYIKVPNNILLSKAWEGKPGSEAHMFPNTVGRGMAHGRLMDLEKLYGATPGIMIAPADQAATPNQRLNAVWPIPNSADPTQFDPIVSPNVFPVNNPDIENGMKYSEEGLYKYLPTKAGWATQYAGNADHWDWMFTPSSGLFYEARSPMYIDICPLQPYEVDGKWKVRVQMLPVGEYDLLLGGDNSNNVGFSTYFNGKPAYHKDPDGREWYDYEVTTQESYPAEVIVDGELKYRNPITTGGTVLLTRLGDASNKWGAKQGSGSVYIEPLTEGATMGTFRIKIENVGTYASDRRRIRWGTWLLRPSSNNY